LNNLYHILEGTTENYPENEVLVFGEVRIFYNNIKQTVDRLAQGLKNLGLGPGDRVAMMLPNIPHFPICYFALLKIGLTIVPVSILYKAGEIRCQLEDLDVKGFIYWEGFRSSVLQAVDGLEQCKKLIVLGEKAVPREIRLTYLIEVNSPLEESIEVDPDDTAIIVYTAGTTGHPKGAELTHRNIMANIDACCQFLKLSSEERVIGVLPLYHPLGQTVVMGSFIRAGGVIILMPKFDAEAILKTIESEKATYMVGVPSMIQEILKVENGESFDISSLKFFLSSGDAVKQETMDAFEKKFKVPIIEGYGLTEASPMVSFNSPVHERKAGSIGLPLPGVEMKIVDENNSEVKPGQVGEIIVQGSNVMKGYLNHNEATKEVLKNGWLHTGDLAMLHENGYGFIVVRKKNVILKSGFNVYPREVENILSCHSKIKEVVVLGIKNSLQGEEIHALIVLNEGETATAVEIIEFSKEQMATYKCPKVIHFVQSIPKGPTGRVLRNGVKELILKDSGQ